jgi:membrane protein DedA with SNARE-associated domain/membrane-associated phospholipid phosphatase
VNRQGEESSSRLPLLIAAVVIGMLVLLNRELPNIDLEQTLQDVGSRLGAWTYLVVGFSAFVETGAFVGLVLPGETVVILGGAIAGQGQTSLVATIGVVWLGAWAGDTVSFLIGRSRGREFIVRHGPKLRITPERFTRVESYFQRHGGKTIMIGRFIGLVRALAPFSAGSSGMRYRAFVPFSILGTGLWAAAFTLIGYFASRSLNRVSEIAGKGTFLFGIVVAVVAGIVVAVRFLREPDNRRRLVEGMERRAALRPLVALGRRLQPPARFLAGRLTPGGIGLEFTTLMAVLAVGLYVLIAYWVVVAGDPAPTTGDVTAFDVAANLRADWLTDVTKVVTDLGSAAVTLPLTALCGVLLAVRRRWTEAAVLLIATAIIYLGVGAIKDAVDRPRPPDPLMDASGWSFPSGHAAHSILYPWLALTLAIRLRPGMVGASGLIAAGIALAVVVGLSRVYLRVHYLSDVAAGWGLGVAAFAGCASAALAVAYLRKNQAANAPPGEDRD